MPLTFTGSSPAFLGNSYANTIKLQAYADAGNCLAGGVQITGAQGGAPFTVVISGHLVSFP